MYYVYIMASRKHGTLYVGVTSNLIGRAYQHRTNAAAGYGNPLTAIAREKEIKKWRPEWKINLIEGTNPEWTDLFESLAH